MQTSAIRLYEYGGPEVLRYEEVEIDTPGAGEALVRHTAIGLNFIDTYHRTGLYPMEFPAGLGTEAAGVVEAVGDGVTELSVGDRVVWTGVPPGAYAGHRLYDVQKLAPVPDGIDDEQAAAAFLKGLTAWYLLHRSYPVNPGDSVLLYAAAGGVGSLTSQWANHLGVTVIGVVSTDAKAERALANGCAHVVMADADNFVEQVRELSAGGVAAAYDSVGRDTFIQSLDCLRPHGVMVTFGNASGPVDPFAPAELAKRHSLFVTRPVLFDFIATREDLLAASGALFDVIGSGAVRVDIGQRYPLADAARAHEDLEGRRTTGSTILEP